MRKEKAAALIGMAQRAGRIAAGEYTAVDAIRGGKAFLVVIAEDASENTKKKFTDKAAWYQVPAVVRFTKGELGHMIGKDARACLAVLDEGLAKTIKNHLENGDERSVV